MTDYTLDGSGIKRLRLLEPMGEPDIIECDGAEYARAVKWIPVSERVPDNDDTVYMTIEYEDGERIVTFGFYDSGDWCAGIDLREAEVIAWMPENRPEPFDGAKVAKE